MCNANYMDGVPVKIAEKYKPPPPLYKLPQHLTNKLNLEENFYWNCPVFSYDLHLEKRALPKIEQWKRIRQRNREQRKVRSIKRIEQRRREDEDRQKTLLYCVSYPSTDDLSSEEEEKVEMNTGYKSNGEDISESKQTATQICVTEKVNSFHNILQPTVLSFNSSSIANNDLTPIIKSTFDGQISNSFNYKDFEEDTSSPFDNIELKSINDLDVLAQVLHNTQVKSATNEKLNDISSDNLKEIPNACNPEREQRKEFHAYPFTAAENIPMANNSLPKFNYNFESSQVALIHRRDHNLIFDSAKDHQHYNNLPAPSLSSNDYKNCQSNTSTNKIDSINLQLYGRQHLLSDDQMTKSKSVPDILKELKDDIRKTEIRRSRKCRHNMEDTSEHIDVSLPNNSIVRTNDAYNENIFCQLDGKAKKLVEQISVMGFPSKRVARIVQLLGTDDKKVVEHLIPLCELADLGFDEAKISDALIRNENDKNKALDDLIS